MKYQWSIPLTNTLPAYVCVSLVSALVAVTAFLLTPLLSASASPNCATDVDLLRAIADGQFKSLTVRDPLSAKQEGLPNRSRNKETEKYVYRLWRRLPFIDAIPDENGLRCTNFVYVLFLLGSDAKHCFAPLPNSTALKAVHPSQRLELLSNSPSVRRQAHVSGSQRATKPSL